MKRRTKFILGAAIIIYGLSCAVYINNIHDQHVAHQQHIEYLHSMKHYRHLRYINIWKPVWKARKHPTQKNLAKLKINHPWHNAAMVVNHNHSNLIHYHWKSDHIHFSHPDKYGRISYAATAYLAPANATGDALRVPQKVKPVGWHQHKYKGDWLLNRGHLIAYSLTKDINFKGQYTPGRAVGNQNDHSNLFTETAFCNQQLQYAYETKIRIALEKGYHVIYQVRPIFYHHDLMARGVHLQAISTNHKLNFNVYLFNVQPGVAFNYKNGFLFPNSSMNFNLPNQLIKHSQNLDDHDKRMALQRQIMKMYDTQQISYQQAYLDEEHILGSYWINF